MLSNHSCSSLSAAVLLSTAYTTVQVNQSITFMDLFHTINKTFSCWRPDFARPKSIIQSIKYRLVRRFSLITDCGSSKLWIRIRILDPVFKFGSGSWSWIWPYNEKFHEFDVIFIHFRVDKIILYYIRIEYCQSNFISTEKVNDFQMILVDVLLSKDPYLNLIIHFKITTCLQSTWC